MKDPATDRPIPDRFVNIPKESNQQLLRDTVQLLIEYATFIPFQEGMRNANKVSKVVEIQSVIRSLQKLIK